MKPVLLLPLLLRSWVVAAAAEFPTPYNSEADASRPLPPMDAAAGIKLPAGFKATVFAAEPDVQNPIAMAWDAKGRIWVAENYTFAENKKKFDLTLRDRILVFDDQDGDGHFDTRRVFTDQVQMLTSVEVGLGGVWAMCPPRLVFIPDRNGDGVPDGPGEVVLDGFTVTLESYHNFANGLRFGPDGWLYGRCGAGCPAEAGLPGTPPAKRIPVRGAIWRYHPRRKVVEALSCGTTNPWGHDWNEHGELFFVNTVNGHLWHNFTGAHFVRPHTIDPNPRAYGLIDQHADHWHFDTAGGWTQSRDGRADAYGGGHAHLGAMVYLGDNWPAEYRGRLLTVNMHGRRANQEILERVGSGYVGKHGSDFALMSDPWFRGMDLSYGPDGGVFVIDWSDTGECHDSTGVHRTSGRIYKITFGDPQPPGVGSITALSAGELAQLHLHPNEWFARQARLELATRVAARRSIDAAPELLRGWVKSHENIVVKLRALWTLYAIGAADESFLRAHLRHPNEHVRTWAIRLLSDAWPLDTLMNQRPDPGLELESGLRASDALISEWVRLAREDGSGLVRLTLASTLQRLPVNQRVALAAALLSRAEDADDHNLPLLVWFGLIPVADREPAALATLAMNGKWPLLRRFIARRLAEDIERHPAPLNQLLTGIIEKPETHQADVLHGMAAGLAGWRRAPKPAAWDALAPLLAGARDPGIRERTRQLGALFGDGRAIDEVKSVALDRNADLPTRRVALQTLIDSRPVELRTICEQLLTVRFLNPIAARGLATFDDPAIGALLVKAYPQFYSSDRPQLLSVLVSRPRLARALLDAVAEKRIAPAEVTAFHARQIRSLNDPALAQTLAKVWGEVRDPAADKLAVIAKWKGQLTSAALERADQGHGREVYVRACAACHTLHGAGGKIGPDLTGGGRDNLDYLLENLIDPSAVVTSDFRMSVVELKDGRTLNGLVAAQTDRTLTIQTMTEALTLERTLVAAIRESALSLMPEGLLEALTGGEARDLIAYLMQATEAPRSVEEKAAVPAPSP